MISLDNYQILEHLYESPHSLVYRARREADGQAVVLKILKDVHPTPERIARFKREHEILSQLEIAGVIDVYQLLRAERWMMVLQEFGGKSLAQLRLAGALAWPDVLRLAIPLSQILGQVHDLKIIHKDINPSNILLNAATGELKLIDFGMASVLSLEKPTFRHPNLLEGTLAYSSPEQTGRMNRTLDYRSDLYSLGITFYELLTGQLPFQSDDALELIHHHIAKPARPPHELQTDIPPVLSSIVLKLMAKNAEERYQSAYGLKADLEALLHQWQSKQQIVSFELGQQDLSDRLNIPPRLYGRDSEIATLAAAFERASQGGCEMMLVAGYSGVGKSALVQEVYQGMTAKRGHFIAGKFDQYQRDVPYLALTQAFNDLCGQLLSETPLVLNEWQSKIRAAVGRNGKVLSDVIPNLELLIGVQPAVAEVGATEAQNRFNLVFQHFIKAISQPSHPLLLFIDDLQWADSASLNLMKRLMHDPESQYLLLIGAYRDNEVDGSHALSMSIQAIKEQPVSLATMPLKNLSQNDVNTLIAETLHLSAQESQPLTDLVYAKTQGNAFFTREFLKSLYSNGFLSFNRQSRSWQWDVAQIEAQNITDNVVELMAGKIGQLADNTQAVLQLAACIGNLFELSTLALIRKKALPLLVAELWSAIEEGLLVPLDEQYKLLQAYEANVPNISFKFQHDRVQQAAYSLMDEAQKQLTHLEIGRLLLANSREETLAEHIFEIVNQFNQGIPLINQQSERLELAKLNLLAGQKAKKATAYDSAATYLKVAQELLPSLPCQEASLHEISFNLYLEHAEVACLNSDFEQSESLCQIAQKLAKRLEEKARVVEVELQLDAIQHKLPQAIDRALEALAMLGVSLLDKPPPELNVAALYSLPMMSDPHKLAALRILNKTLSVFYIAKPALVPTVVFTMLDLSVKGGNSPFAPIAYISYALILSGFMGEIEAGYQFGKLALSLLDKFEAGPITSRVQDIFLGMVIHWKEHAQNALEPLRDNIQSSLEHGETEYAGYTILFYFQSMIWTSQPLEQVYEKQVSYLRLIQTLNLEVSQYNALIWLQFVQNLKDKTTSQEMLIGDFFNQIEMIPYFIEVDNTNSLMGVYLAKVMLAYLLRDYPQAVANASLAKDYEGSFAGLLLSVQYKFYHSLALLALYPTLEQNKQVEALAEVSSNQQKMNLWANHAPMNYQHKFDLVEAEKARVLDDYWAAAALYEQAIQGARNNDYLHEEALAYELAGEFYLARGFQKIAQTYLTEAHYGYQLWQAGAKVKQLEERYPQWLTKYAPKHQTQVPLNPTLNPTHTAITSGGTLDLGSLLKASQAISGEIILSHLLEKMMKIVLENAGAERGLLLLSTKGQWLIEAESSVYEEQKPILQSIPITQKPLKLSNTIVHYVIHSKQALILNDARHEEPWKLDHYVLKQQPKSIIAMPLINQGQVKALLYLENNLNTAAFTPDRVELLRLLSSQMTVSLDNARLYNNLEELVEQRTKELHEAKKEAELAKETAEAASQAKSDFLSNMSHELRTPLNGILGYAQILKRDRSLSTSHKNQIGIIHQSGHHLLTLINDILDLSKIEARKMELYPQDIHLQSFLNSVVGIIRMRAIDADVLFVHQADEKLPTGIKADEKRLRQVLINLLGNAVKFTQQGQVTLKVSLRGNSLHLPNNHVSLRFEIIDSGVGMTLSQLSQIFLPFEQVGDAKQRAKGTGLGLAITRQLVKLMGGDVHVESELGKGSRFWFDLSCPVVEVSRTLEQVEVIQQITGYKGKRLKVLVVDDKAQNRHVLRDLLTPLGFEILEGENGQQAVELAQTQKPDLLLTDLVMPVMNGFKAVKAIRQFDRKIPIIAISASVWEAEQQMSLKIGCNAFLSKPVSAPTLLALIEKHLAISWRNSESTTLPKQTEEQPLIPPPPQQLEALYEAAILGMMSQIRKQMDKLEQLDAKYAPFANKVRELAKGFEDEKIVALLEGYLAKSQ